MNLPSIIILVVLAVLVVFAVLKIKNHKTSCGGDCSRCGGCAHQKKK